MGLQIRSNAQAFFPLQINKSFTADYKYSTFARITTQNETTFGRV